MFIESKVCAAVAEILTAQRELPGVIVALVIVGVRVLIGHVAQSQTARNIEEDGVLKR